MKKESSLSKVKEMLVECKSKFKLAEQAAKERGYEPTQIEEHQKARLATIKESISWGGAHNKKNKKWYLVSLCISAWSLGGYVTWRVCMFH